MVDLKRRLDLLRPRDPVRTKMVEQACNLYGISRSTLYRYLLELSRPKPVRRSDYGVPRDINPTQMEHYCEIIAAMKLRTSNKKARRLSTARCIELLETYGMETPNGPVKPPKGLLNRATIDRHLRNYGFDYGRLTRPRVAMRFQAKQSNEMWQFDMSPSDLKKVDAPLWIEEGRGKPTLMLFSVVDDRSGVVYQEYRCVYGEESEAALRFMFNAMAAKDDPEFSFQGIPGTIYTDNGPVARSQIFRSVMAALGVQVLTHVPASKDKRRTTARAKGKVERPFRTVKDAHETLYHFHKPENEAEANLWLHRYLIVNYNNNKHRSECHSRADDWAKNLPKNGFLEMCSWERFCTFAREPESRTVAVDARISVNGAEYEVDPELAGEKVTVFWGLFDQDIYVEHDAKRYGPFQPAGGAIPLWKYRKLKRTKADERVERISALAEKLGLPRAALTGENEADIVPFQPTPKHLSSTPFPDRQRIETFSDVLNAKLAIAEYLGFPLAKLSDDERTEIDAILADTLDRISVLEAVRIRFKTRQGETPC